MQQRWSSRLARYADKRLREAQWMRVADPRSRRGRRWALGPMLSAAVTGMMSGTKSLAELERLSSTLSPATRRMLGVPRRLADTTMRELLCKLDPLALRPVLHRLIRAAHRRHSLTPEHLPFGVVAMDGKVTALPDGRSPYAQRQTHDNGVPYWLMRTVTSCLVTARAKPCIDVLPIPAATNEMGIFAQAFAELVRHAGTMFRLVTYDAGAASAENARLVVELGKDYLFRLKNESHHQLQLISELLIHRPVAAFTIDVHSNTKSIVRTVRLMSVRQRERSLLWPSIRTLVRVDTWVSEAGQTELVETRHAVSSLATDTLSPHQWLIAVRAHWAVENNVHHTLDAVFTEDDKPMTPGHANGALVVMVLRRIAYTLLALFRSVTLRAEHNRQMPWRELIEWMRLALITQRAEVMRVCA